VCHARNSGLNRQGTNQRARAASFGPTDSTQLHSGVARVGTTGPLIASDGSQLGGATAQRDCDISQAYAANRSEICSVDAAKRIARAEALREIGKCGAQILEGEQWQSSE
jgi:hypothetical protein